MGFFVIYWRGPTRVGAQFSYTYQTLEAAVEYAEKTYGEERFGGIWEVVEEVAVHDIGGLRLMGKDGEILTKVAMAGEERK